MNEKTFLKLNIIRLIFVAIIMLATFIEIIYSLSTTMVENGVLVPFFSNVVAIMGDYHIIALANGVGLTAAQQLLSMFLTGTTLSVVTAIVFLLIFVLAFIRLLRVAHHLDHPLTYYRRNNVLTIIVTVLFFILLVLNAYFILTGEAFGDLDSFISIGTNAVYILAVAFYFIVLTFALSTLKKHDKLQKLNEHSSSEEKAHRQKMFTLETLPPPPPKKKVENNPPPQPPQNTQNNQ